MMKVAVLTMHAINNYGSVLQTLATKQLFESMGCKVEIVDYVRETAQLNSFFQIMKYGGPGWRIKCKQLVLHLLSFKSKRDAMLESFRREHLNLSDRAYRSDEELENNPPIADIYCTGSDQTWNTVVQGGVPKAYFLHFVPVGKRRIALSASFGIDELPEKDIPEVKTLLSQYDFISVREASGYRILQDLGFSYAVQVLDPTLAVGRDFWTQMASERIIDQDYIFVYQLNSSLVFTNYVNQFAEKKGLPIVYVKSRKNTGLKNSTYLEAPKPEEFLSLFKYSSYVITDSFHATAFCLVFHCNFIDIYPEMFSTRLDSILELTGLKERHLTDLTDFSLCENVINYNYVDRIIDEERVKTLAFISKAISK